MTKPKQLDLFTSRADDLPLFSLTAVTVKDEKFTPQEPKSEPKQLTLDDNGKDVTK